MHAPIFILFTSTSKIANISNHQERRSKRQANRLVNTLVSVSKDIDYILPFCLNVVTVGKFELLHHANPGKVYGATWSKVCVVVSILVSITVPPKRLL